MTINSIINNFTKKYQDEYTYGDYEQEVEFEIFRLLGLSRNENIQDWLTEKQYETVTLIQGLAA